MPTLTFKVSPAEARAIRGKARAERGTVSAFLRTRALDAPPAPRKIIIKKHIKKEKDFINEQLYI